MTYQLVNARVWDGSQWVAAVDPTPPVPPDLTNNWPTGIVDASVTVTTDSVAHVMGAWTEVTSSLTEDGGWLTVSADTALTTTETSTLMDVGVGPAGSESVIVESLPMGYSAFTTPVTVPVFIPAGSRVVIRAQSNRTSRNISTNVFIARPTSSTTPTSLVTIGANRSVSGGSVVLSTLGVWYEVTASTAAEYRALVAVPVLFGSGVIAGETRGTWQTATGASGSEVVVVDVQFGSTTGENFGFWMRSPLYGYYGSTVAAGTRLAIRTGTTGRTYLSGIIFGVPA